MASRPKLNTSVLGYALYLTINTASLWGGVFPFFPAEFHTTQTTFVFALSQSISMFATYLLTMLIVFLRPQFIQWMLVLAGALPVIMGSLCLIGAIYIPGLKLPLVILAGILLGIGGTGFAMGWQRYFASEPSDRGNYFLLFGMVVAPFFYVAMHGVPDAFTVYLVPLILVPLCALCSILATRTIDFEQAQFEDVPRDHPVVYVQVIKSYWRAAAAIGSLGFSSGVMRAVALSDYSNGDALNIVSMFGSFAVALALLVIWRYRTFRINIADAFLIVFPFAAVGSLVFPFVPREYTFLVAGAIYMLFTFVTVVMLLQCAQISRDRGVNQAFVFGFFGSIVYLLQNIGFIAGYASDAISDIAGGFTIAFITLFALSTGIYVLHVRKQSAVAVFESGSESKRLGLDDAEFIADTLPERSGAGSTIVANVKLGEVDDVDSGEEDVPSLSGAVVGEPEAEGAHRGLGSLTVRCREVQEAYRLTNREGEIMRMLIRNYSYASIAEVFVISENTVRTHVKHIYAKLDIHKRQELIDMVDKRDVR